VESLIREDTRGCGSGIVSPFRVARLALRASMRRALLAVPFGIVAGDGDL
jgi:hypothetical protein